MFSVIMPCTCSEYKYGATDRENKLRYAIISVIKQSYKDWELIIISDGCDKTIEIYQDYSNDDRIKCIKVNKQKLFSGNVRQAGLEEAKGDYIIYLDSDDYYGENHLKFVADRIGSYDWVYFNEICNAPNGFSEKIVKIEEGQGQGIAGTSSMCHKRGLADWKRCHDYRHDWTFIERLIPHKNNAHIGTSEYYICHMAMMDYDTPLTDTQLQEIKDFQRT